MNTQVGKSAGIALLLAAALIAALFAMGVFAPGVGADSHGPTATAQLVDPADLTEETTDTATESTANDTLVITFSGLTKQAGNSGNSIVVTLNENAWGTPSATPMWKGGNQYEDTLSGGSNSAAVYTVTNAAPIEAGTAVLEIGTDTNTIDSNTMITALTIGRDGAQQTVANVPISIGGADDGPTIALSPMHGTVGVATDVDLTGADFTHDETTAANNVVTITAALREVAGDGTVSFTTAVDINGDTAGDVSAVIQSDGTLETSDGMDVTLNIPASRDVGGTDTNYPGGSIIRIRASTVGGADTTDAMFTVNTAPTFEFAEDETEYGDVSFISTGASAQTVSVAGEDNEEHDLTFSARSSNTDVATVSTAQTDDGADITVTPGDEVGMATITVTVSDDFDMATTTFSVNVMGADISTSSPGADVRVEISTHAMMQIPGGDDIMVTLEGFGIPDTIDASDVIIQTDRNINPSDIAVDVDEVTLSLPSTIGDTTTPYNIDGAYSIVFKQGAGLTTPTSGGDADITVDDMDSDPHEMTVEIDSSVSVDPSFVTRGGDATVTAKGLEDGTATVHLNSSRTGPVVGSGTASDGVVEIVIDTSDLVRGATRDGDIDKGDNTLYVKDASNNVVGSTTIGIKPAISLGSDSVKRSGMLEITVSDWYYGDINRVAIGGVEVAETTGRDTISVGSDYKATFEVTVPASTRFGKQEVKVEGSNPDRLKTFSVTDEVTIDALAITISPDTVVPGAQITITGSGYVRNTEVMEILIGDEEADLPDEQDDREATSAGRIAYTVTVPMGVGDGEKDVQVTVGSGADERVGVGEITVPEPSIELDPDTSVPGSIISVNGTGFASSGRVEVRYRDAIEEVGRADSTGDFHIRLEIPSDAGVGKTNEVKVEVRGTTSINATAEHKTPGAAIMVPETAQVGTLVTISGSNFEPFSNLDVRIGGRDATPSEAETDKNGGFEIETRVPRLAAGSHTVTVMDAEDNSVSETFTVTTTAVVYTPEEIFAALIEAEQLVSVWRWNNAMPDNRWDAYFPENPDPPVSDLVGVSRGDIVWIEVTENVEFQGVTLYVGTNSHVME